MGRSKIIKCNYCKKKIKVNGWLLDNFNNHFCNRTCQNNFIKENTKKGKEHPNYKSKVIPCKQCGTKLERTPYQIKRNTNHFCNRECQIEYNKSIGFYTGKNNPSYKGGLVEVNCTECGKIKKVKQYRLSQTYHYCSKECMKKHKSTFTKDKAYNWQGGVNKLQNSIRKLTALKEWTQNIFERDLFTCQKCLKGSNKLEAHHLIGVSQIIKMNKIKDINDANKCVMLFDLNNGVTMCKKCHREFHKLFGVINFTPEDYYKFIGEKKYE